MIERNAVVDKLRLNLPGNAADLLAGKIRSHIISGEIPAGYIFPNETVFCEQLGVSRSTLREAYKALESTGFIKRVKRFGTMVNDFTDISKAAPLGTSLIMSDWDELIEFRVMIEAELARLAALRAGEDNIRAMEAALRKMQENSDHLTEMTRYDTMFHMEIAKASRNRLLISTMENAKDVFQSGIYRAFQVDTASNVAQALQFHTQILDAITRKDSSAAYELMRRHIESVDERMG
jgi:GntR family transcriptional repressor for pyruvate dehydrogenase complex